MSFQAYIDTIREKTGLGPADFRALAEEKGLLGPDAKAGPIVSWLAEDYDLGRGHAMALFATMKPTRVVDKFEDPMDAHFSGAKAHWRPTFDALLETVNGFGDVALGHTNSYISLLKGKAKFAIVAVTSDRLDIGIKRKDAAPEGRFEAAGNWNSMVTHRVRVTDAAQVDAELTEWLRRAYDAA
jgi:hypothetical protein